MIELGLSQPPRRPEIRESYTEQVLSRLVSFAAGASDGAALGAVETAARLWGSGLASATVSPTSSALRGVSPAVLDSIGRALCRQGESLHVIAVRQGRVVLTPTASWNVLGSDDPASWLYQLTLNGPTTSRTITLPAASVLHVSMRRTRRAPGPDVHLCSSPLTPPELLPSWKPPRPANWSLPRSRCYRLGAAPATISRSTLSTPRQSTK